MVAVNRSSLSQWAPFALRLVVGGGFIAHAYAKLSRGPDAFAAVLHALFVPAPHIMAWLTILVELIGGLAVLLGAFISVASVPLAAVLVVAMLTVHWHYGFNTIKLVAVTAAGPQFGPPGVEINVLYLGCLIALVLGGPGPLAADSLFRRRTAGHVQPTTSIKRSAHSPLDSFPTGITARARPTSTDAFVPREMAHQTSHRIDHVSYCRLRARVK
jgi:putative oxidoreductase